LHPATNCWTAKVAEKLEIEGKQMANSKGKAIITGASSGIGAVYADRLAKRGQDLILVARDSDRLAKLAGELTAKYGIKVDVLKADLTARGDVAKVEKRIVEDSDVTLLINNAGIGLEGGVLNTSLDAVNRLVELNVLAVSRLGTTAAQTFAARGKGTIVNIASVLALAPERFNGLYTASKAYVLNFSQALDAELKDKGVCVQAVLPGATYTEIWERAGIDVKKYDPSMVMDAGELVDAALAGLDTKETVTIPPLADESQWTKFNDARLAMGPNLSRNHAAARYGRTKTAA
jgi:uncharacterized protein